MHRIVSANASHYVLNCCMAYFIRVDAANAAVHELVAELVQEPQAGAQQEDAVERAPEEIANPADLQGKPRSISLILITPCYIKVLCIYVQGIDWNHRCIILATQCLY